MLQFSEQKAIGLKRSEKIERNLTEWLVSSQRAN